LPPWAQQESIRIDQEVRRTMQEAAPLRKFQQEWGQAVAPFEPLFRSAGISPIQAAQSAFTTIQQLQTFSPTDRAQIFATLLRTYPTNLEALAAAVDGQPAPQGAQGQPQLDPRAIAAQVRQEVMQGLQAQRQEAFTTKAQSQVEAFASDPAHEFFEDVWSDMAGLIDASGGKLSLEHAYDRAVWANPELRAIVQQREVVKSAATAQAATQCAIASGGSLKTQPATPMNGHSGQRSVRDDVEAAYARLSGR